MLPIHQNVVNIVQTKFPSKEIVKCILNVSLAKDSCEGDHRILALVERGGSFALFVIISVKPQPTSFSDLTIERAIPVDQYFSCDTDTITGDQKTIIFNVIYKKLKLPFKIEIGLESANFASEVIKSKEVSLLDFDWLDKYTGMFYEKEDNFNDNLENQSPSPDIPISRQRIAQGQGISSNRESILRYQLGLKEAEYTEQRELRFFVGTWNVNGHPPSVSLRSWLSCDEEPPDLYAVGFQELDLSKEAFLFNDTPREDEWRKSVVNGIHPDAKYHMVALVRLVGIQLIVLVHTKHYLYVKNVAVDTVGTGILGKMGNKGGVAVRLELYNTSLCFVNSHFAAHVEEFERRNQDYSEINSRVNFRKAPHSIRDHDQVYWLGDLNYRVTDMTALQVKAYIAMHDLLSVLHVDQLNQQRERGKVLQDYTEGDITFQPTYKYDPNTDVFDTSEKARAPAWTDRVLWRGKGINQIAYRSHMELKMSDHKPVSAVFKSEVSVIDEVRFRKVHEELLKKMDKLENEFLPQVTVDQTEVVYDLVKFREAQYREIIIANTGQVPAEFEFIKKLDDTSYCKEWLTITPYSGCIKPGEKCDVQLKVYLETDLDKLDDILVLHLVGGKDMFIIVSGECQKSSFTASVSTLVRLPVPILHASEDQLRNAELQLSAVLYSVPREIWLLVDNLYRHGLKTKDLFDTSALPEEFNRIRNWLDAGVADPISGSVTVCAESLLIFLSYTKDPIIPYHMHDACIAASSNFQLCKQVVMQRLPDLERNVLLYLCMFLQELLRFSNDNGFDAKMLALIFGDILLRDRIRNSKPQASRGKVAFIHNFLVNDLSSLIIPNK